jgi:hypothetical protein
MWYNSRPMPRRGLSLTLLAVLAVQLIGGMVFASVCFEPCPDDTEGTSCPPICTVCASCTHAQTAIVRAPFSEMPLMSPQRFVPHQGTSRSSHLTDDILHVPLLG